MSSYNGRSHFLYKRLYLSESLIERMNWVYPLYKYKFLFDIGLSFIVTCGSFFYSPLLYSLLVMLYMYTKYVSYTQKLYLQCVMSPSRWLLVNVRKSYPRYNGVSLTLSQWESYWLCVYMYLVYTSYRHYNIIVPSVIILFYIIFRGVLLLLFFVHLFTTRY